jgi:signal peptidase I
MENDTRDGKYQLILQELVRESLSSQGIARLRVISDSMAPLINVDDFVIIEQPALHEYRCGDIVVIDQKGELITHRLVRTGNEKWYTKGDRFRVLDDPVSVDDLIGKVIEIESQDNHLDLKCKKWIRINRFRGWLANIEVEIFRSARWYRRYISQLMNKGGDI